MGRYLGPACRLCRRAGEKLMLKGERCLTPKCALEGRNRPPGMQALRRQKLSERGLQLREKQKVRHIYGVLERQFRRHFAEAERRPGITGQNLLEILEMRLDNVVYRLGLADSRRQARQVVCHGHILLNGRKTDIPSCVLQVGDAVSICERDRSLEFFKLQREKMPDRWVPPWLSLDADGMSGRVLSVPARADIEGKINEQAIVGYYSR